MVSVAVVLAFVVAVFVIWLIASLMTGWRKDSKRFLHLLVVGAVLHSLWIWFGVGISPLQPSALMSQLALMVYGALAHIVGRLSARWFRKGTDDNAG